MFNFSPATTVLEAIAWVAYVVPTMTLFIRRVWLAGPPPAPAAAPAPASVATPGSAREPGSTPTA